MQTPTIGRIVIAHNVDPAVNNGAAEAPAIITRVWPTPYVNAQVLLDSTSLSWWGSVPLFDSLEAARQYERDTGVELQRFLTWPERT